MFLFSYGYSYLPFSALDALSFISRSTRALLGIASSLCLSDDPVRPCDGSSPDIRQYRVLNRDISD